MYFRARYYSPQLGQFISRDPLGYVDGMSQYRAYFVLGGLDPMGTDLVGLGSPAAGFFFMLVRKVGYFHVSEKINQRNCS